MHRVSTSTITGLNPVVRTNFNERREKVKDKVLEDIKNYAVNKLKNEYSYCGSAEGDNAAMLNSDDGQGNDIKITIEISPE